MSTIFVRFPFAIGTLCLATECAGMDYSCLRHLITAFLRTQDFLMYCNGKEMTLGQHVPPNAHVHVSLTLPGGKGGFGSMLRAIGAQIEKTTNREACRDLSGRRLRDINEEQRLKKWIAKKAEREAEKIRRRKERIERLKSVAKHNFVDFEYEKEISSLPERIDDALTEGIEKAKKRPLDVLEPTTSSSKKNCLWLDEDLSSTSDSDSDLGKNSSDSLPGGSIESENEASCSKEFGSETSAALSSQDNSSGFRSEEETPAVCVDQDAFEQNEDSFQSEKSSNSLQDEKALDSVQEDKYKVSVQENKCVDSVEAKSSVGMHEETARESETLSHTPVVPEINSESKEYATDDEPKISKEPIQENDAPIDLLMFNSMSDLETLGLERLKSALMIRGLKCGGNITDRAKRLWAVRGLEPHEYPKNLLAKQKK